MAEKSVLILNQSGGQAIATRDLILPDNAFPSNARVAQIMIEANAAVSPLAGVAAGPFTTADWSGGETGHPYLDSITWGYSTNTADTRDRKGAVLAITSDLTFTSATIIPVYLTAGYPTANLTPFAVGDMITIAAADAVASATYNANKMYPLRFFDSMGAGGIGFVLASVAGGAISWKFWSV